jgi:hypothetical protein
MRQLVAALPLLWLATVAAAATPSPSASPTQNPTPTPVPTQQSHGSINLSAAATPSGSAITVTGSGFSPGEAIAIFLDSQDHTLGGAVADQAGNFKQDVKVPDGTAH